MEFTYDSDGNGEEFGEEHIFIYLEVRDGIPVYATSIKSML